MLEAATVLWIVWTQIPEWYVEGPGAPIIMLEKITFTIFLFLTTAGSLLFRFNNDKSKLSVFYLY